MILVLMGSPGAGKGTQAKFLANHYHLTHLSTGDLLRGAVAAGSELGKTAKSFMEAGKLVPDDVITDVVLDYLKGHAEQGILLDGYPRTIAQAKGFGVATQNDHLKAVSLDICDEDAVDRLSSRRVCSQCGRVYNPTFGLEPPAGRCQCGGSLIQRVDDRPDTILKRLMVYHAQTEPVIDYYSHQGLMARVDGAGDPADVFNRLKEVIG